MEKKDHETEMKIRMSVLSAKLKKIKEEAFEARNDKRKLFKEQKSAEKKRRRETEKLFREKVLTNEVIENETEKNRKSTSIIDTPKELKSPKSRINVTKKNVKTESRIDQKNCERPLKVPVTQIKGEGTILSLILKRRKGPNEAEIKRKREKETEKKDVKEQIFGPIQLNMINIKSMKRSDTKSEKLLGRLN